MGKDFIGINHGKKQINLNRHRRVAEFKPVEIHLKEDGSIDDGASFAIVMSNLYEQLLVDVYGQISLKMFNEGLKDIGYKIEKL